MRPLKAIDEVVELHEDVNVHTALPVLVDPLDLIVTQSLPLERTSQLLLRGLQGLQLDPAIALESKLADGVQRKVDIWNAGADLRLYSSKMAQGS